MTYAQPLPMFARAEIFGGVRHDVAFVAPFVMCEVPCLQVIAAEWNEIQTRYYGHGAIFSLVPLLPSDCVMKLGNERFRQMIRHCREGLKIFTPAGILEIQAIRDAHAREDKEDYSDRYVDNDPDFRS